MSHINLNDIPEQQLIEALPESLSQLACVLPVTTLVQIVETFGGQDLYIPFNRDPNSKLHQRVGNEQMDLLRRHFAGNEFNVPKLVSLKTMLRDRNIAADRQDGMRINDLAAKYALSGRRIQDILRRESAAQVKPLNNHE